MQPFLTNALIFVNIPNSVIMRRILSLTILMVSFSGICAWGQTKDELERKKQQLKKEIQETEKLLNENKTRTKENLLQYNLISKKVNLQNEVIQSINKDVEMMDVNMQVINMDVRRYDRLLDTLRQEYAKSMVYAYKNRSNFDFLNFIFSASNFNDAIKRINYLKSYRTYREMQGQAILRMQEMRKKRFNDLNLARQQKNVVLNEKSKEVQVLAKEQQEKDRIVAELKKKGAKLTAEIAQKQKQIQKVNNAIAEAIRQAQLQAKKEREAREAAQRKANAAKNNTGTTQTTTTKTTAPKTNKTTTQPKQTAKQESVLLNDANAALNASFERNKGSLPWPVDKGYVLMHYGSNTLHTGTVMNVSSVTISSDIGNTVKSVFQGEVIFVKQIDNMSMVVIQHGRYFTTYSNLTSVSVQKGAQISTGQSIGRVGANLEGLGAIDFYISNESTNFDPEKWLRRK
jgi:septal ring factor EnvC (AmiA/AmiB activator)